MTYRTLEGSAGVFAFSWAAVLCGVSVLGVPITGTVVAAAVCVAAFSALTEAVAPHGGDNFFLMVVPAYLTGVWLVP